MRFINKKIIVIPIFLLIIFVSLINFKIKIKSENSKLDDVKLVNDNINNKGFAVMIENDSGEYVLNDTNEWPNNMIYNKELSGCIDISGNKIDGALTFENNKVTLNTNTTIYCYLYFDRENNIYNKLIDDYKNNDGVSLLSETSNDTYPVYYYTGNITNNNIIYADFCWKMVRTTDTGGVKLIYNGAVTNGSCNNTEYDSHIQTSGVLFNEKGYSPAYVGYMYNTVYSASLRNMSSNTTEYVYGNSVSWNGSSYTLVDTTSGTWGSKYSSLSNNHYTCFSTSTTCTNVYYIYWGNSSSAYYLTLTGRVNISDALNEMLYVDDVNKYDSTIKVKVDSWYESNIKGKLDSNNNLYSNYLENTIFCNNRATTSLGGWNPNGGSLSTYMYFNYDSLTCENQKDQFTLKESAGGTFGYGNNKLDYPVGLLTYKEATLATPSGYLYTGTSYWLISPNNFSGSFANNWTLNSNRLYSYGVNSTYGIRPAISLSKNVLLKENVGDGTASSPYEVILP